MNSNDNNLKLKLPKQLMWTAWNNLQLFSMDESDQGYTNKNKNLIQRMKESGEKFRTGVEDGDKSLQSKKEENKHIYRQNPKQ